MGDRDQDDRTSMVDDEAEGRAAGAKGREAGQYRVGRPYVAEWITTAAGPTNVEVSRLMAAVIERSSVCSACLNVVRHGGVPGVDGLTAGSVRDWLKRHGHGRGTQRAWPVLERRRPPYEPCLLESLLRPAEVGLDA